MKPRPNLSSLAAACLALLGACRSTPEAPPRSALALPPAPPPSALAALVRSLEAVDALRDPQASVQVRAIECDSLLDHSRPAEYVRVFLHVTVFAQDVATARRVFEDLSGVLRTEARSPSRPGSVTEGRVRRVFDEMAWQADDPPGTDQRLVSYSDAIRLEVCPGHLDARQEGGAGAASGDTRPAREYIQEIAGERGVAIAPIETRLSQPTPRSQELRCLLRPGSLDAHFTRSQIGGFLLALEEGSPAARVTRIVIERASQLPDVFREDGWTFEATLTVRVPA